MTEKQLATAIETAVNNYGFNPKKVASEIPQMHRTLQQSVYKMCRAIIEVIGAEDYAHDSRNAAAHEECKAMLAYLKAHGRSIPTI